MSEEHYESRLASKCQGVARCLSYNGNRHEAEAKHVLLEAFTCSTAMQSGSIRKPTVF